MNLTSKRMLIGLAACVSACALTASAVETWVEDSFEEASTGDAIDTYKAEPYYGGTYTNYLWQSMDGDASKILTTEAPGYAGDRPITNVSANLHLNLETEGTTLVRYLELGAADEYGQKDPVSVGFSADTNVYVDTLIKFTPSEDDPEITDTDVKVAVFVNANSNLVVYHKTYGEDFAVSLTNTVFESVDINPDVWNRLTIQIGLPAGLGEPACQVFLNKTPLSHPNGYTEEGVADGTWFILANSAEFINNVSFQGTGAIDEFVVADSVDFGGTMGIMLTLAFDSSLVWVYDQTAGAAVSNNGTVPTGNEIRIEAANWYEIASVTGVDTGSFTGSPTPGALVTATTGTVSANANDTLTITAQPFSSSDTISTGLGGSQPANKVAAWALSQPGLGELTPAMLDDYLLDVPAGTDATISITSVEVSGTTVTIKVAATDGVNLGEINGTLKVVSSDTLPVSGAATYIPFTTTDGVATIVITNSGKFIKARIE